MMDLRNERTGKDPSPSRDDVKKPVLEAKPPKDAVNYSSLRRQITKRFPKVLAYLAR